MGLAHSSLEKHREAVENFKKALELEPDNESYKSNLQIAEDKVKSGVAPSGGMGGMFPGMGGPGGMDLSSFLNNPALMNMATTMLQDPNMQAMMGQMMGGMGGPGAPRRTWPASCRPASSSPSRCSRVTPRWRRPLPPSPRQPAPVTPLRPLALRPLAPWPYA